MKLWLGLLVLFTAAAISCVAAYFSVVGLVALFAASAVPVMIMGGVLEFAKLVGSGWLKFNWDNGKTSNILKFSLVVFIANLMVVTSIGIYGFLMAGHLEQSAPRADLGVQTQQLELQVTQRNEESQRLNQRLTQIDQNIAVFLQNDQASKGLRASDTLKRERTDIQSKIEANNVAVNTLNTQLSPLKIQSNAVEAKLGPVKYFAKLLGLPEDNAVQIVIVLIMIPFDPLAVALLLAALQSLREYHEKRRGPSDEDEDENGDTDADRAGKAFTAEENHHFEGVFARSQDATNRDDTVLDEWYVGSRTSDNVDGSTLDARIAAQDAKRIVRRDLAESERLELIRALAEADMVAVAPLLDRLLEVVPPVVPVEPEPEAIPEVEDRSDYDRANMADEVAIYEDAAADENILRLAGLRPEAEREIVAAAIPVMEEMPAQPTIEVPMLDLHVEDELDQEPIDVKEVDRDTLIGILERHPNILNEIEQIVEEDVESHMSDREKLLDLLEKNPGIINDMAEIFASQITKSEKPLGDSWLK